MDWPSLVVVDEDEGASSVAVGLSEVGEGEKQEGMGNRSCILEEGWR